MHTLRQGEYINEEANLDQAFRQLITQKALSLLVTRGEGIVGILRLADVFVYFQQY